MRLLSYSLGNDTPTYADNPKVSLQPASLIETGGVANWFTLTTINHNGTHVDAPWHFNPNGAKLTDLSPDWFVYQHPRLIDIPKGEDELITAEDLEPHASAIEEADMLLIRTGFGAQVRSQDPKRYGWHAPGFHPSAARYLKRFPMLRAVVMDFPSAAAPQHREEGFEFHRIALGAQESPTFFLLVEDAKLDPDLRQEELNRIVMAPLLLEGADAAPVTILAE
jgi:arylformamidase